MRWRTLLASVSLITSVAACHAGDARPTPLYDPEQFPEQRGVVQQFTLTPHGDIDGMILSDGVEVKTPPHLSTQIAYAVRPGDSVIIHGLRAAALPLVKAVSIVDERTRQTVVDDGPPGPGPEARPPPPPPPPGAVSEMRGRIRMTLHGPEGDVNGARLEDGTILRLPPLEATSFSNLLQPNQAVIVHGVEKRTTVGSVFDARELSPSADQPTRRPQP